MSRTMTSPAPAAALGIPVLAIALQILSPAKAGFGSYRSVIPELRSLTPGWHMPRLRRSSNQSRQQELLSNVRYAVE